MNPIDICVTACAGCNNAGVQGPDRLYAFETSRAVELLPPGGVKLRTKATA